MQVFNAHELANTLWAMAKMGTQVPGVFETPFTEAAQEVQEFNALGHGQDGHALRPPSDGCHQGGRSPATANEAPCITSLRGRSSQAHRASIEVAIEAATNKAAIEAAARMAAVKEGAEHLHHALDPVSGGLANVGRCRGYGHCSCPQDTRCHGAPHASALWMMTATDTQMLDVCEAWCRAAAQTACASNRTTPQAAQGSPRLGGSSVTDAKGAQAPPSSSQWRVT